jgi:hypothetical protein
MSRSISKLGMSKKFDMLYEESSRKLEASKNAANEIYSSMCTFKPAISPVPDDIAEKLSKSNYMDRMEQFLNKKEALRIESQRVRRSDPNIGKKKSHRPPTVEIHEYLYGCQEKIQKQREEQVASQREEEAKKNSLKRNESAEKIVWKNMDGKLIELFNILDVNGDSYGVFEAG